MIRRLTGGAIETRVVAAVAGTGAYVPSGVVANQDLMQRLEVDDAWIVERTGIRERRQSAPHESTSTLGIAAAKRACEASGIPPEDVDLVICATVTPDYLTPATASLIQHGIGAERAAAFDISSACTGFIAGLQVSHAFIAAGIHQNILLVGAETMTKFVNPNDRGTSILFGDGAGAALLTPRAKGQGLLYCKVYSDGSRAELITLPAGGSKLPATRQTVDDFKHCWRMDGKAVFKFASTAFSDLIEEALAACQLDREDIRLIVPHQVNRRIIEAGMKKLGLPIERCQLNLERFGNTSAASVPIALDEAIGLGRVGPGDLVLFVAFGAGLTWGVSIMRL